SHSPSTTRSWRLKRVGVGLRVAPRPRLDSIGMRMVYSACWNITRTLMFPDVLGQPFERVVPLRRNRRQKGLRVGESLLFDAEADLAAKPIPADQACTLQDAQMLGQRLAADLTAARQLDDRLGTAAERAQQSETAAVSERVE